MCVCVCVCVCVLDYVGGGQVAIKKHKMDGSMMDHKALTEFEIEARKRERGKEGGRGGGRK